MKIYFCLFIFFHFVASEEDQVCNVHEDAKNTVNDSTETLSIEAINNEILNIEQLIKLYEKKSELLSSIRSAVMRGEKLERSNPSRERVLTSPISVAPVPSRNSNLHDLFIHRGVIKHDYIITGK